MAFNVVGGETDTLTGSAPPVAEGEAAKKIEGRSPWRLAAQRLLRDRASMIALGVIILIILIAILAPVFAWLTGHGVNQQFRGPNPPVGLSPTGAPVGPSRTFLLGTDDQGRDILVRIAYGTRMSLFVGLVGDRDHRRRRYPGRARGRLLREIGRYRSGPADRLAARLPVPAARHRIDLGARPRPGPGHHRPRLLQLGFGRPHRPRPGALDPGAGVRRSGPGARRQAMADHVRSTSCPTCSLRSSSTRRLLIPVTIVAEASLSFLGVGIPPPTADWGGMINEGSQVYLYGPWWLLLFPSLALLITTLAFNIFGDGVRDAFDPRGDLFV